MYVRFCMHEKVHHIFVAARYIVCVCVCVYARTRAERDQENGCEGQLSPCASGHTPTFLTAFTSFSQPLPSSVSVLHHLTRFCIFSGGIWFHHGLLGLRGGHNDWRIVHLQPQGGGPHLPGLPR